jgi:hypothetical protein
MQAFCLFRPLAALASVAATFLVSTQATAVPVLDQSVAWQQNARHDGFVAVRDPGERCTRSMRPTERSFGPPAWRTATTARRH